MKTLEFKWTISKGRDTYGYNICTLYIDGKKTSSCNGGGYDMQGSCLGEYIEKEFKEELLTLEIPWTTRNGEKVQEYYGLSFHDPNFDPGKVVIDNMTIEEREEKNLSLGLERYQEFYKASSLIPTKKHTVPSIDGSCGFSSVEKIINALGYTLTYIPTKTKNNTVYILDKTIEIEFPPKTFCFAMDNKGEIVS